MSKGLRKFLIIGAIGIIATVAYNKFGLSEYLSLAYLKENQSTFDAYYRQNGLLVIGIYFLIYVISTAFSVPGAMVLTLAGGAIFGLATGLLVVSFASTIGATLAFLVARFVLRESFQTFGFKFGV